MVEKEKQTKASQTPPEPVWTYRGYQLKASEFTTAMVHFFRAEVTRANVWRQRLDTTTNWAVVTTGAVISFAFHTGDLRSYRYLARPVIGDHVPDHRSAALSLL